MSTPPERTSVSLIVLHGEAAPQSGQVMTVAVRGMTGTLVLSRQQRSALSFNLRPAGGGPDRNRAGPLWDYPLGGRRARGTHTTRKQARPRSLRRRMSRGRTENAPGR